MNNIIQDMMSLVACGFFPSNTSGKMKILNNAIGSYSSVLFDVVALKCTVLFNKNGTLLLECDCIFTAIYYSVLNIIILTFT